MKTLIQQLAERAADDPYLKQLVYQLEKDYAKRLIQKDSEISLKDIEKTYLMRFADILCRSERSEHKNFALKIISLMIEFIEYRDNQYFKMIATNILIELGNFPSLPIIKSWENSFLVNDIKINYILKEIINMSPLKQCFTDGQLEIFEELKANNHYSFSGTTSFGKSYLFECFTKYLIEEHHGTDNIVFLVPTKALINQVSNKIRKIVSEDNYRIINTPQIPKILMSKKLQYVFVFTPERLIKYFQNTDNPKIDYLFVDEAHKLLNEKDTRTPLLYHALILAKRKSVNIYFASPNIPNSEIFLEMVGNSTEESKTVVESPVAQNRFYINCSTQRAYMISDYGKDIYYDFQFTNDPINNLFKLLNTFSSERQSIIYCNTIEKTITTAIEIAKYYPNIVDEKLDALIEICKNKVHEQYYLSKCLRKGIAYHFGGVPEEIKAEIESLFRKGVIRYLFCTSTLLEGVNLPAKNIFILSEKIGNSKMKKIDFWNLAGRAGRLTKDLSGNIFCVNIYDQENYWKNENSTEIVRNKIIEKQCPQIMKSRNNNLYKNLGNYLMKRPYTNKRFSENEKKIIEMYGNILVYHDKVNSDSILKDKFLNFEEGIKIIKKVRTQNHVPSEILAQSIDICLENQNNILNREAEMLPLTTDYSDCLKTLQILYKEYNWDITEGKGKNPMIKSENSLSYYAVLLNCWVNGRPLKYMIQKAIDWYHNDGNCREIKLHHGFRDMEIFNKDNDVHVNKVINDVIRDLENIVKFKIKNYIVNYQMLQVAKNNIIESDWELYIEYGTTDTDIIAIQNLGFSRNMSLFLKKHYFTLFKRDELNNIIDISSIDLKRDFDKEAYPHEYNELSEFFSWAIVV